MSRARWMAAAALLLAPGLLGAQGLIAGNVRDAAGERMAGVHVSVHRDTIARARVTTADGIFLFQGLPAGEYVLVARKAGYLTAESRVAVPADSAVMVNITLTAASQQLPRVVVEAAPSNRVHGRTMDGKDQALAGVTVEVIGSGRRDTTDAVGGFGFADLDPGLYLVQFRKKGFAVAQTSVRLEKGTEQEYAVRMLPIGDGRYTPELAAVVAREADRRRGMAGGRSAIVGRDELERFGKTRLNDALSASSGAIAYWSTPAACVLIDGHDDAGTGAPGALARNSRRPRGPTSIRAEGAAVTDRAQAPPRTGPELAGPISWLGHFRADEVEMVEIYPEGTENSRTLCGRFRPSSGCSCPPEPAGIVIWLR